MINRNARRYLRQVRTWLPCGGTMKRQIMEKIRSSISRFLEEEPSADYDIIVSRFGTPQQIASAYVDEQDTEVLLRKLRIKRRIVAAVCCAAAACVVIWLSVALAAYVNFSIAENGYAVIEIVTNGK